jgi:Zn-dependent metalloprotease
VRHHSESAIACILPPHILLSIARNGDARQRDAALRTISRDQTLRSLRGSFRAQHPADAARGRAHQLARLAGTPNRTVFDCHNGEDFAAAAVVRREGEAAGADPAVNEAYDGLGATYDLYWDVYHRDSIDDAGLPLNGYVHYGSGYDNAFWDGQEMVFGDGDGELFNRFTISIDVIGHELTHGVTEHEVGLTYHGQSGALNESVSDVFGSLVKQRALGQKADEADWLIGAGLLAPGVQGVALRSMKDPGTAYDDPVLGKDPQPADMSGYVTTTEDNGGVHLNSGIPNRAFCLAALNIGGYAWEVAGAVWYETLRDPRLKPSARFTTFARATLRAAVQLGHDKSSTEYAAIRQGWNEVGVRV